MKDAAIMVEEGYSGGVEEDISTSVVSVFTVVFSINFMEVKHVIDRGLL